MKQVAHSIIGPVPLSPTILSFNDINEARSRFNFELAVNLAPVLVKALRCVQRDIFEGKFPIINVEECSRRTADEDVDFSIIVASIGILCNQLVWINGPRKSLVAGSAVMLNKGASCVCAKR